MNAQAVQPSRIIHLQTFFSFSTIFIFVGAACMVAAGFLLIEGLSRFSGDDSTRNILIVIGILFQVSESLCFMASAALTKSFVWRVSLFCLGVVLFTASIGVMTLAQKTAIEAGETTARAIDEQTNHLRSQIQSLDESIASYRDNAEKQSQSIYAQSRALGQDSINRAVELENEKRILSDKLFELTQQRQGTSSDFFQRLEEVTGLPAKSTEFYFLAMRSLLIELCGVVLLSFGAYLSRERGWHFRQSPYDPSQTSVLKTTTVPTETDSIDSPSYTGNNSISSLESSVAKPTNLADLDTTGLPLPSEHDVLIEPEAMDEQTSKMVEKLESALSKPNQYWANENIRHLRELRIETDGIDEQQELEQLTTVVHRLYREGEITTLGRDTVRKAVSDHCDKNIGSRKAMEISRAVKKRLSEAGA